MCNIPIFRKKKKKKKEWNTNTKQIYVYHNICILYANERECERFKS